MPTAEQPIDIRTVTPEEYWMVFEKKWTSLLSYRYLGRVNAGLDKNGGAEHMRLRHDMRNPTGGIMMAPLCIFSPESGGMNDDEYVPNPVIASMQILDEALGVKRLRSFPEVVRLGRQMGFSRTLIVDDDNHARVIAISEGMGVSLGGTPAITRRSKTRRSPSRTPRSSRHCTRCSAPTGATMAKGVAAPTAEPRDGLT